MDKHPTDKRKLKGWLNQEEVTPKQSQELIKLWDVIMLWSGYDGLYDDGEIAYQLGITKRQVRYKVERFKELFPDAYEKLSEDRALVRKLSRRHSRNARTPLSWEDLDPDIRETWIKEKF